MRLAHLILPLCLLTACESQLRVRGSAPVTPLPEFRAVEPQQPEYKVWVVVPWLQVNTYPLKEDTQQPMLQFTGDQEALGRGLGQVAMIVSPDRFRDGESVIFFEDKLLWTDRLRTNDPRHFTLWLRENNRSAPTRYDAELKQVEPFAQAIEEISGAAGFKIPARRAINISNQAFKELQQDWLILRWTCPWSHVIKQAERRWSAGKVGAQMLRTRLVTQERAWGKPVAMVDVMFVVKRLVRPLPRGVDKKEAPRSEPK